MTTTRVTFEAPRATCEAGLTDTTVQTIRGVVAPYGQPGRTSAGVLRIRPGALHLPTDLGRVKLTLGHDRDRPIGVATGVDDAPQAMTMEFRPGSGPVAQAAYAECAEGVRDALSLELDNMTVRAGWVERADVLSAALLPFPAYPDAVALAASDHPDAGDPPPPTEPAQPAQPDPTPPAPPAPGGTPPMHPSTIPGVGLAVPGAGLVHAAAPAGSLQAGHHPADPGPVPLRVLFEGLRATHTGERAPAEFLAALSDITQTANEWTTQTQFAGELWSGVAYQRRFVPLVNNLPLTSYNVNGWRWVVKPVVAPYAGDKAAVPSNAATTQAVTAEAERLAGAHDVDRKFRDFGDTGFFESYYRAMTESYALLSDLALVADLETAATAVAGGPFASLSAGIVAAILAMPDDVIPEWVIAGKDLLPDAMAVTSANKPAYLELRLNLTRRDGSELDGRLGVDFASQLNGQVLVGARQAATFYELNPTPIRVEAVNMVNGGVDPGVFGYYATIINKATALQLAAVTP
jgi:hypothetical protein